MSGTGLIGGFGGGKRSNSDRDWRGNVGGVADGFVFATASGFGSGSSVGFGGSGLGIGGVGGVGSVE